MQEPTRRFLDTSEAAAFIGLSPCTLEAWRVRGGGPSYHKFGKAIRYSVADLEAFITKSARANTSRVAA